MKPSRVVITISGGVAEVAMITGPVIIEILDFDNPSVSECESDGWGNSDWDEVRYKRLKQEVTDKYNEEEGR